MGGNDSAFYSFPMPKRGEKEKKNTSIFVREVFERIDKNGQMGAVRQSFIKSLQEAKI